MLNLEIAGDSVVRQNVLKVVEACCRSFQVRPEGLAVSRKILYDILRTFEQLRVNQTLDWRSRCALADALLPILSFNSEEGSDEEQLVEIARTTLSVHLLKDSELR